MSKCAQAHSDIKNRERQYYNRELNFKESNFVKNDQVQFVDKTDEILVQENAYYVDQAQGVEVTFGNISENTQREFKKLIGHQELLDDTLIRHQEKVSLRKWGGSKFALDNQQ